MVDTSLNAPLLLARSLFTLAALAASTSLATGCSSAPDEGAEASKAAVTEGGRTTTLHYLGSQRFLLDCAGNTLGCGQRVASVPDSTPYFSAPSSSGAACDEYWTFRVNGKCVEARRLESSDSHGFIEGNPGLFDALGLPHSDGTNCSGSGTKPGVTMERGRHCDAASTPGAGTCNSGAAPDATPAGTELLTTADLNLRDNPSLSATVLTVVPSGETVVATGQAPRDGWYSVKWNGTGGWMSGTYLEAKDGAGLGGGCEAASTGADTPTTSAAAPTTFTRQHVYDLVKGHMRPGAESAARDFLNPALTTQKLVDAVGWLATHNPPAWEISAVNSNHHYDPAAHSGGHAMDLYATSAAADRTFVKLMVQNPHIVELGFSGDYVQYASEVHGKTYFTENAATHVHAATKVAYGSPR